jgi:hypothetical protein
LRKRGEKMDVTRRKMLGTAGAAAAASAVVGVSMLEVGCALPSSTNVLLSAITAAVDVALSGLSIAFPGAVPTNISGYLNAVLSAVSQVTAVLQSTDTPVQKAAAIVSDLMSLATTPALAGVNPVIVLLISAVGSAVNAFLAPYLPAAPAPAIPGAADVHSVLIAQLVAAAAKSKSELSSINSETLKVKSRVH